MPCFCSFRKESELFGAIKAGVQQLAALPGVLSILRNGGCEQTLRNFLISEFEKKTRCTAFTEGEKRRVDIVLRCVICEEPWANVEIKSNFSSQIRDISERRGHALGQLKEAAFLATCTTHSLYLHLVTHLQASAPLSALVRVHNQHVPPYKRFLQEDILTARQRLPIELRNSVPVVEITVPGTDGDGTSAVVLCWCFYLADVNEFV